MATTDIVVGPAEPPEAPAKRKGGLSPLTRYLLVRLALIIPMLWILVTMVFLLMRVIGDPISAASPWDARPISRWASANRVRTIDVNSNAGKST